MFECIAVRTMRMHQSCPVKSSADDPVGVHQVRSQSRSGCLGANRLNVWRLSTLIRLSLRNCLIGPWLEVAEVDGVATETSREGRISKVSKLNLQLGSAHKGIFTALIRHMPLRGLIGP